MEREEADRLTTEELIEAAKPTKGGKDGRDVWTAMLKELREAEPSDFLPEGWDGETI